ncbi:MAG: hypothetical protein Q7W13_04400 [Bacteroidia bacterium]|nr:hypothetical protein [Bacteroidia bacterium]
MDNKEKYKYEVGFSFLKQDESIAFDINDKIQDRLTTFIYSKKQEELGATDGERQFNKVFYEESRIVVLLYRDGWGHTPWTRIEETAIKNRAFDNGWDFLIVINLDPNSTLPKWIPQTYIWLDYPRFKSEGAIAVIDQRVKEKGGKTRVESIGDRADRLKRLRNLENEREAFLNSHEATQYAFSEMASIIQKIKSLKTLIEDPSTNLHLSISERTSHPPMFELGYENYCLCFNNSSGFESGVNYGKLRVSLYTKSGYRGLDYQEKMHKKIELKFDRNLIGQIGWSEFNQPNIFCTTEELIDKWVKDFIDNIEQKRKK